MNEHCQNVRQNRYKFKTNCTSHNLNPTAIQNFVYSNFQMDLFIGLDKLLNNFAEFHEKIDLSPSFFRYAIAFESNAYNIKDLFRRNFTFLFSTQNFYVPILQGSKFADRRKAHFITVIRFHILQMSKLLSKER